MVSIPVAWSARSSIRVFATAVSRSRREYAPRLGLQRDDEQVVGAASPTTTGNAVHVQPGARIVDGVGGHDHYGPLSGAGTGALDEPA